MPRLNPTRHPFSAALFIALLLGAFLAVSGHVVSADADHVTEQCVACTWFQVQGWIAAGSVLLIYLTTRYISSQSQIRLPSLFWIFPPGRSPPLR